MFKVLGMYNFGQWTKIMIQIRDFRTLKVEHDPGMSESVIFERGNSNVFGINCPPGWNRVN